jgi:hypothetical protein
MPARKTTALQDPKKRLLIFAIIFALIGGLIIWQSNAKELPRHKKKINCAQYVGGADKGACQKLSCPKGEPCDPPINFYKKPKKVDIE